MVFIEDQIIVMTSYVFYLFLLILTINFKLEVKKLKHSSWHS